MQNQLTESAKTASNLRNTLAMDQVALQLNFYVSGCVLIKFDFSAENLLMWQNTYTRVGGTVPP